MADATCTQRHAASAGADSVADLGSGRGFFLEALRDRAIPGIGVVRAHRR